MMEWIVNWFSAFRLRTLPLALSSVLVAAGLAKYQNMFKGDVMLWLVLTTVFLQVLSNLANDYGDTIKGTDNVNRVGPERSVQGGKISLSSMKRAVLLFSILSFVSGSKLLVAAFDEGELWGTGLFFLLLGLGAIAAAIKYTMGKSPYGYSGKGDVFVFLFFGLAGVIGGSYLFLKDVSYEAIFGGVAIGALSTAVLNMNNMRDVENDKNYGKRTLVVQKGIMWAKKYHVFLIIIAFVSWVTLLLLTGQAKIVYVTLLPFVVLFQNVFFTLKNTDSKAFDPELKKIALSTFVIALLFFMLVH